MGAEQSSTNKSTQNLHRVNDKSVTDSNGCSNYTVDSRLNRSLSNLNEDSTLQKANILLQSRNCRTLDRDHLPKSSSRSGIVVVNPGRNPTSSSVVDLNKSLSTDFDCTNLRDLKRISTFEPFSDTFSRSRNSTHSLSSTASAMFSESPKSKCFVPKLNSFGSDKLISISKNYEQFLNNLVKCVSENQSEILAMQTKIDVNLGHLADVLQLREKGARSSTNTTHYHHSMPIRLITRNFALNGSKSQANVDESSNNKKLAGSAQIEMIILETSQIASLISQSIESSNYLIHLLNDLNKCLAPNQRLEPMASITL